jgi:hypothetical protein
LDKFFDTQEVESIFPELVSGTESEETTRAVAYANFAPLLVEAFKEQQVGTCAYMGVGEPTMHSHTLQKMELGRDFSQVQPKIFTKHCHECFGVWQVRLGEQEEAISEVQHQVGEQDKALRWRLLDFEEKLDSTVKEQMHDVRQELGGTQEGLAGRIEQRQDELQQRVERLEQEAEAWRARAEQHEAELKEVRTTLMHVLTKMGETAPWRANSHTSRVTG